MHIFTFTLRIDFHASCCSTDKKANIASIGKITVKNNESRVPFKVKCPIRIIIFGIFTALFLKLNLNTKYRFACSIWSNNQCQWLLEFYDTRFTVGITADSLNLHLFQRRHVLPNLTKILSKIKKKKLKTVVQYSLWIKHTKPFASNYKSS